MRPKMSEAMWKQEQEIDYGAAGGERVLKDLLEKRWKEIVITDPAWEADQKWNYKAGLDFGKSHPTSFHGYGIDFEGGRYALFEHYQSGNEWTPAAHTRRIREMRAMALKTSPLALSVVQQTFCDPSMGFVNVAQPEKFTSYVQLFTDAGFPNITTGFRGSEGMDKAMVDEIRQAWSGEKVKFKILCRGVSFPVEPGSMKKREGTYENGCPNLLWELLNIRRKENTATRSESVGPAEGLVDKDNDAWDDLKYWWTSNPVAPLYSETEQWRAEVEGIRRANPNIDINSLAMRYRYWKQGREKMEEVSWR